MDHFNLETLAVSFSIAYVIFAAFEKKVCWWFGLAGSLIYIFIFYDVNLYMESLLSVYYAFMAVCGLFVWGKSENKNHKRPIIKLDMRTHFLILLLIITLTAISGYFLTEASDAYMPYLDSFTTWSSVIATILVVRKVLENWIYWISIDTISIYIYLERDLNQTVFLYFIYLLIAITGFLIWKKNFGYQSRKSTC